jgi:hypothetical protein
MVKKLPMHNMDTHTPMVKKKWAPPQYVLEKW